MNCDNMPPIEVDMKAPKVNLLDFDLYRYVIDSYNDSESDLYCYRIKFPNVYTAIQVLEKFQLWLEHGLVYSFKPYNNTLHNMLDVVLNKLKNERKFYEYRTPEEFPVKICVR